MSLPKLTLFKITVTCSMARGFIGRVVASDSHLFPGEDALHALEGFFKTKRRDGWVPEGLLLGVIVHPHDALLTDIEKLQIGKPEKPILPDHVV